MIFNFFTRDFLCKKIECKKFLKGFLWKIEAGGKFLKGISFIIEIGIECWAIPAIDLMDESESESESIFGPLNFFIFGYVEEGV